jgi:hypothetical protein
MKKLILLLILLVGAVSIQAQTVLPSTKYIYTYTGVATDTVGAVGTTWNKAVQLNKLDGLFYNASVKVSDVTAGAKCSVALQGKVFAEDAYTTITTVTWYGGGTDTTILFTQNTNKVYWRYLNVHVTRLAMKAKVNKINLSLKK